MPNQLTLDSTLTELLDFVARQWASTLTRLRGSDQQVTTKKAEADEPSADALWLTVTLEGMVVGEMAFAISSEDIKTLAESSTTTSPVEGSAEENKTHVVLEALRQSVALALNDFQSQGGRLVGQFQVSQAPAWTAAKVLLLESSSEQAPAVSVRVLCSPNLKVVVEAAPPSPPASTSAPAASAPTSRVETLSAKADNLDLVMDALLEVSLRFGAHQVRLAELAQLGPGSVIELDRRVEDPVELVLGNKVLARGEVMIVDGNYGLRVTELVDRGSSC